ncbi:hypothetical protein BDZ94DRAFT_1269559 [Collybia nuda]|uniref:Uncharacterized protein n=1 Tax=Collybia nuda TaxID=64659 RepID=A0A9P5Y089_9AGAR|nr:hypothetical protein BDZ94DRAFT_1269559 [Collybia nuda]
MVGHKLYSFEIMLSYPKYYLHFLCSPQAKASGVWLGLSKTQARPQALLKPSQARPCWGLGRAWLVGPQGLRPGPHITCYAITLVVRLNI